MPDANQFKEQKPSYTILLCGLPGAGKTRAAMTFPKVYVIGCDPSGLDILKQKGNEKLLDNLVYFNYLHNESEDDLKKLFNEKAKADDFFSVYGCLAHAKELAQEGAIETLVLDGFNYFVDMRWQYVNEYHVRKSERTGAIDTQAMYRDLGLYLNRFFAADLMTMATRLNLNVVVTCHVKRENPDTVEGVSTGANKRAGKVAKESDIAPQIEGGFRNKIDGLVGAVLYLEHSSKRDAQGQRALHYVAHTQKSPGLDTVLMAKNRYGLPTPLVLTNGSLYDALMAATANVNSNKAN